ncbi:MAG: MBL fold metallo-hydrolase [Armatimonadetes bacterium]|nr:MBL fold metallo-hydrolase [Anaerolineae bacterium]
MTVSHAKPGHNNVEAVKSANYILDTPGEYEIGGVFVYGIPMHFTNEDMAHYNVAYLIQYGGLNVLHLGDLMHVPEQSEIEAFGQINVLLLPVGGGNSLRAGLAAEVVALIEPNYVVPMHYALPGLLVELDPVDKFLKEMGISKPQEMDILKVTSAALSDQPQVVVLRAQT